MQFITMKLTDIPDKLIAPGSELKTWMEEAAERKFNPVLIAPSLVHPVSPEEISVGRNGALTLIYCGVNDLKLMDRCMDSEINRLCQVKATGSNLFFINNLASAAVGGKRVCFVGVVVFENPKRNDRTGYDELLKLFSGNLDEILKINRAQEKNLERIFVRRKKGNRDESQ